MLCARTFALLVIGMMALACLPQGFTQTFERRRGTPINPVARQPLRVNKRVPGFEEVGVPVAGRKRSINTAEGAIALPLNVRKRSAISTKGFAAQSASTQNPQDGGSGDGGTDATSKGIVLTVDLELKATLDGIDTSFIVCGDELLAPGSDSRLTPFDAPKASDTGIKWKRLEDGGDVHKADFTFGDGTYTVKGVAYGDRQGGQTHFSGQFGMGLPNSRGKPNSFPEGSPPSLTDALADQLNITSASVVVLDSDYTLVFGQEPFVDVDPKAFAGSVVPQDNSWFVSGTINGSAFVADISPANRHIFGDADQIQQFFGDQQPTQREDSTLNYYDVPCEGGPPIEFQLGDKDGGVHTIFYEDATLYSDKESSTGCTSILIGAKPDPERYATSWSLGNAFQYHYTPSYHWEDPSNPILKFYGRPSSLYSQ